MYTDIYIPLITGGIPVNSYSLPIDHPIDLLIDLPIGLPVDLSIDLPVDLPIGLPVDLPNIKRLDIKKLDF